MGGYSSSNEVDGASARNALGYPMIPASAIKGAVRETLDRLLNAHDPQRNCHPPKCKEMCGRCLSCTLFGSWEKQGILIFRDAHPANFNKQDISPDVYYETRQHCSMYRDIKIADDRKSRTYEIVRGTENVCFVAYVFSERELTYEEKSVLTPAIQHTMSIGGGKSRGLGWISMVPDDWEFMPTPEPVQFRLSETVHLEIQAISPLNLGNLKPFHNFHESLPFIPGRALRGAIARFWQNRESPAEFQNTLGLCNSLYFGNGYPLWDHKPTQFLPLTFFQCGICTGPASLHDLLFFLLIQKISASKDIFFPIQYVCPSCGHPLCKSSSLLVTEGLDICMLQYQFITRLPGNRITNASQEETLHTIQIIPNFIKHKQKIEQLAFMAQISHIQPENAPKIAQLHQAEIYLGGGRTRGLGHCKLLIHPDEAQLQCIDLAARIQSWNKMLHQNAATFAEMLSDLGLQETFWQSFHQKIYFSLTCISELAISGNSQAMVALPTGEYLRKWYPFSLTLHLEAAWFHTTMRGEWNHSTLSIQNIIPVFMPGSVFVYSIPTNDWEKDVLQLTESLVTLEKVGLGLKTKQGFGSIAICQLFAETYPKED